MNLDSFVNAGLGASLDRSNINNEVKQFVIDITSSTLFGSR